MTEPEIITTSEPGAEVVACAETEATATTRVEEESRNVHAMSKEELLADLRQIVETKSVNSHREVMAIKQALFS
ncbi:MAG: hypothetical protein K2L35_07830, partial [Muribaculaceae bacterium]|nr:hypothetical protein [Muribaculaceae bacterium]